MPEPLPRMNALNRKIEEHNRIQQRMDKDRLQPGLPKTFASAPNDSMMKNCCLKKT